MLKNVVFLQLLAQHYWNVHRIIERHSELFFCLWLLPHSSLLACNCEAGVYFTKCTLFKAGVITGHIFGHTDMPKVWLGFSHEMTVSSIHVCFRWHESNESFMKHSYSTKEDECVNTNCTWQVLVAESCTSWLLTLRNVVTEDKRQFVNFVFMFSSSLVL